MANKQERKITGTVRHGGVNYAAGQEDALEAAGLSKAEIQRLTDTGTIEGFGATVKAAETAEAEADTTESVPAKTAPKTKSK